jgi:hypothetical protein
MICRLRQRGDASLKVERRASLISDNLPGLALIPKTFVYIQPVIVDENDQILKDASQLFLSLNKLDIVG